jgi:hypothetical protein
MNDYPLPSHAVAVWFDGDGYSVRLPPEPGRDRGHVVRLHDLSMLAGILRERATAKHRGIGTPAAPTQAMLDTTRLQFEATKCIKENKVKRQESRKAPPPSARSQRVTELNLEDLGLL